MHDNEPLTSLLHKRIDKLEKQLEIEQGNNTKTIGVLAATNRDLNRMRNLVVEQASFIHDMNEEDKRKDALTTNINILAAWLIKRHRYPLVRMSKELIEAIPQQIQGIDVRVQGDGSIIFEPLAKEQEIERTGNDDTNVGPDREPAPPVEGSELPVDGSAQGTEAGEAVGQRAGGQAGAGEFGSTDNAPGPEEGHGEGSRDTDAGNDLPF